jgi:cytochrome c2
MSRILGFVLITLLAVAPAALAEDLAAELVEAEGLYDRHCGVCHGLVGVQVERAKAAEHAPAPLPLHHAVRLAMDLHPDAVTDTPAGVKVAGLAGERMAIAPPFGPNLTGVYGRPAGTVESYNYSEAFLGVLRGMVWNSSTLDVWLTSTQAWVPGVRMYYKQDDSEIRRKIILFLKESS